MRWKVWVTVKVGEGYRQREQSDAYEVESDDEDPLCSRAEAAVIALRALADDMESHMCGPPIVGKARRL